jgi:hypothetical protein
MKLGLSVVTYLQYVLLLQLVTNFSLTPAQFGLDDEDAWQDEEEDEFEAGHPADQCHPQ